MISEGNTDNALTEVNNMITAYNDVLNSKNNAIDCFAHLVHNIGGNENIIDIKKELQKLPTQTIMSIVNKVKKNLNLKVN